MKKSIAIVSIILMTILPALMGAAQAKAVQYKSTYRGVRTQPVYGIATTAAAPTATFQSTSAYSSQWSNETTETLLNNDGSVNSGAYMSSGPRRAKMDDPSDGIKPPDEDDDDNTENGTPLGEGILALLLMAGSYAVARKKSERVKGKILIVVAAMLLAGCAGQKPDSDVRNDREMVAGYAAAMINARMTAWHNKDAEVGFPNANSTNGITNPAAAASWDYVPGVVAKGILDVWEYYQDSAWADAWYEGLCAWGLTKTATDKGGILDDLNCTKVFLGLYEGAKPGGRFENADNAAYFMEQLRRGARGLEDHKNRYTITSGGAEGGWMHKATDDPSKSYYGQMWCDGAYMGPALLAQLLVTGATEGTNLGWNDVYDQFEVSWPYLWDEEKQLPYHVLFTDIVLNNNARAIAESGHVYSCAYDPTIYHSEEYWGRAAGWYMLALVDVLEAYLENLEAHGEWTKGDPLPSAQHFDELRSMLTQLADGLVARQDKETGCWYQLLAYGPEKCATQGIDDTGSDKYTNVEAGGTQCNYLESSASCLITAALLKGSRLGLIDQTEAGKRGYEGIVKQFVRGKDADLTILGSCQSAGLSKDRNGSAAYYLIGKDVPIQNNTEGKVLGAFLMAAVEYDRLGN